MDAPREVSEIAIGQGWLKSVLSWQCHCIFSHCGSADGQWQRSGWEDPQREGMLGWRREACVGWQRCARTHYTLCFWLWIACELDLTPLSFLSSRSGSPLFQLVDFEAMTAPGSEAFSKIAKSWMNLKR